MCIHKDQLTELDIYHRILRFKNYSVAMMNKSLLPARVFLPVLGDTAVLSRGLRYNIDWILFCKDDRLRNEHSPSNPLFPPPPPPPGGPWSPFESNWHLREEYKRANRRLELAAKLSAQITWVALANLVFSPVIFLWQLMYFFCSYGDVWTMEKPLWKMIYQFLLLSAAETGTRCVGGAQLVAIWKALLATL